MKPVTIFDEPMRIRDIPAVVVYCFYFACIFGWEAAIGLFSKGESMLNGKKTWLGLVIAFLPSLVTDVVAVIAAPGDTLEKAVGIAGKVLVVVGAAHKLVKGS